ncbi:MAG: GCG_CRPN prefix-to-repeats domain-containing protein [Lachnospiraceae bacterium]
MTHQKDAVHIYLIVFQPVQKTENGCGRNAHRGWRGCVDNIIHVLSLSERRFFLLFLI